MIAHSLTPEEIRKLRTEFQKVDVEGRGEISPLDLKKALSNSDNYTKEDVDKMFEQIDIDQDGTIGGFFEGQRFDVAPLFLWTGQRQCLVLCWRRDVVARVRESLVESVGSSRRVIAERGRQLATKASPWMSQHETSPRRANLADQDKSEHTRKTSQHDSTRRAHKFRKTKGQHDVERT